MKQLGYVHIEEEKDDKLFTFSMPMDAPLSDSSEVALRIFKAIDKMYRDAVDNELKAAEKNKEETEKKKETVEKAAK